MRLHKLIAAALAGLTAPATAQTTAPLPMVPPPPPLPRVPPPMLQANPVSPIPDSRDVPNLRGRQEVQVKGFTVWIELVAFGASDPGAEEWYIQARLPNGRPLMSTGIERPGTLILLLADPRMSDLWTPLLQWAGPDLGIFKQQYLERARKAMEGAYAYEARNAAESATGPVVRGVLQYAQALDDVGRKEEAIALLRARLGPEPRGKTLDDADLTMLWSRLGKLISDIDPAAGVLEYAKGEASLAGTEYAVNFTINRAATLAESGRYAEALKAIDQARAEFDALQEVGPDGGEKLQGAYREFDWIRACALKGLGRTAESAKLFRSVRAAPEPPRDQLMPPTNLQVGFRAALCMRDRESLVEQFVDGLNTRPFVSTWGDILQPHIWKRDAATTAFIRDAARDPRVVAAAKGKVRALPDTLTAALNRWNPQAGPAGDGKR